MLVQTFSHLIPQTDDNSTTYSSASTSTVIPDVPYDELVTSGVPTLAAAHRHERRQRAAPYPLNISANAAMHSSSHSLQDTPYNPQPLPLHTPQPMSSYNPIHAFDSCSFPSLLGSADPATQMSQMGIDLDAGPFGALSATHMATNSIPLNSYASNDTSSPSAATATHSPSTTPPASGSAPLNVLADTAAASMHAHHQIPALGMAGQVRMVESMSATVPPPSSSLCAAPAGELPPPQNTFPTPSELLSELAERDKSAQKDQKRQKKRKAQHEEVAKTLGYQPTDPDTISSHDKKRFYLDCLEQYVLYLHSQLRLVGVEPVPVERVSSGRGLTSRSIRTMIVHLQKSASKLHGQRNEAEAKYNELRAQLGASMLQADTSMPSLSRRHSISYSAPTPQYQFP